MFTITKKIEGNTDFAQDTELRGMVAGNVLVKKGVTVELSGMVTGSLTMEPESEVNLRGTVIGDVINRGGDLAVWGVINGDIRTVCGNTEIDRKAIVDGVIDPPVTRKLLG